MPKGNAKRYSIGMAVKTADVFFEQSQQFIEEIGPDINVANQKAVQNLGGLTASATMFSLAVELYLKTVRFAKGLSVPDTHHLWSLYRSLPQDLKTSIESKYESLHSAQSIKTAELIVALWFGMSENDLNKKFDESRKTRSKDLSVKGVLLRSSDAFITWRYFHEKGADGKLGIFRYEFLRLGLIGRATRSHIVGDS
jgi:HEPN domain-containing protein